MIEKGYGASFIGNTHVRIKKPNQDSYLIINKNDYTLAIICDGLGSKKHSQIGSKTLCNVIKKQIGKCFREKKLDIEDLIPRLQKKWKKAIWPIKPKNADTTCIFAIVNKKNIIMCQIGDGLCVLKADSGISILSCKEDDFSNETISFFKSKPVDWSVNLFKKNDDVNYKIFLCSDGISEDLKIEMLSEFIDELAVSIPDESKTRNNECLLNIIKKWPNKYSNDDKTMVVIK